jgi:hypothetical protein
MLWRSGAIRLVEARKTDCGLDSGNGERVSMLVFLLKRLTRRTQVGDAAEEK